MVDASTVYGIVNVLSVVIPGPIIVYLTKGIGVPAIRNLSILFVGFSVVHGLYHLAFIAGLPSAVGNIFDFVSVMLLIVFGLYYKRRVG